MRFTSSPLTDLQIWRRRQVFLLLLLIYIAYVLFLTLAPFQFRPLQWHHFPWPIGPLRWDVGDVITNVFLFVPMGIITLLLPETLTPLSRGRQTVFISGGVSLLIETLQIIIQGRFPSFLDLFTNTLGGGIGLLIVERQRNRLLHLGWSLLLPRVRIGITSLFVIYSAFLLALPLRWGEPFSGWTSNVRLLIGNHPKQIYPWNGELLGVAIYNVILPEDQITRHYQEGSSRFAENAVKQTPRALYTFEKPSEIFSNQADAQHSLDLHRRSLAPTGLPPSGRSGLMFDGSTILTTLSSESKLNKPQKLTVEAWFYAQPQQGAGGRLISFVDEDHTLWYLHQDGDEMILGVRDHPIKRGRFHSAGIEPLLLMPPRDQPLHLVGIYDPEQVSLFVNGKRVAQGFLTNGFFVLFNFLNLDRMPFGGRAVLGLALFFPLGLLMASCLQEDSITRLMRYTLGGECLVGFILWMQAQHPVLFFTPQTMGVPFFALLLGTIAGRALLRPATLRSEQSQP